VPRESRALQTIILDQLTTNQKMELFMRGLLNGSTLIAPMVTMKDHLLIKMTLDQANTTFRVILERDPNIQWEIRERMNPSIRTLVLLIIILWTV
jgi:hypothetical protein